jgi:outer membrane immunogenic protein
MRRFSIGVASVVATAALTQFALAADLPIKAPPIAPAPVVAAPSWTGFYIGGDFGGAWMSGQDYTFADPGGAAWPTCGPCGWYYDPVAVSGGRDSGIIAGIHVGYNWQFAPAWLLGVEGDFTWTNLDQSVTGVLSNNDTTPLAIAPIPVVNSSGLFFKTSVNWLASLRGRVGWIFDPAWLVYATGGVAWADTNQQANATCPAGVGLCVFSTELSGAKFSANKTQTGFVVGGGVEWQFASHWRARLEYLYYGFDNSLSGSSRFLATGGGPLTCVSPTSNNCNAQYTFGDFHIQTARVGISYAF